MANKYIVDVGELVTDPETQEKFVTIVINKRIMHFIFAGLAKYKEGIKGQGSSDKEEKFDITQLTQEFVEVNDVLNNEVIVKTSGKQEPNPVEDTEGTIE